MTVERPPSPAPGFNELLGDTLRHAADLVHSEMALLRAELAAGVRQLAGGLVAMFLGAVFLVIALGLVVDALVAWLVPLLGSEGAAAFVCAIGAGIIAAALFALGWRQMRVRALFPERSASSMRSDARLIGRRVS